MSGRSAQWRPASRSQPTRARPRLLPRRAMASLAPPSPSVKKLESMARHVLRLGPPSSDGKIRPAGRSGKGRGPQIGYEGQLLRWVTTTRAWLGAAKAMVHRRFSRSQFSVRPHLICCRGVRAHLSAQACEKGRPRLRLHQSRGRARSRQLQRHNPRVKSVGLGPHAAVWPPSLGCPLGRSLPRLPMVWRGLARGLRTSPPMVVRPGSTQLPGFEVRFLVSGPREGVRPSCGGDSASR